MSGFLSFLGKLFGFGNSAQTQAAASSAEQLYQSLLTEEQHAAKWVSGSLAIINQNITIAAPLLIPIIQSVFPAVTLAEIESGYIGLVKLIETDQSKIPTTLEGAITWIQQYLQPKQGNPWITAVSGLFQLAVTVVMPGMPIQKIAAVGEYIYQDIITPLLGLHKSTATPSAIVIPSGIIDAPVGTVLPNGNMVVESAEDALAGK